MMIFIIIKNGRICTATDDKIRAEKFRQLFSKDGKEAKIEAFDSNIFSGIIDYGYKPFFITATYDAAVIRAEEEPYGIDEHYEYNVITKNLMGNYVCRVIAKDEEHAKKNFRKLFARLEDN